MRHSALGNLDHELPVDPHILGEGTAILEHRAADEASHMVAESDVGDILADLDNMPRVIASADDLASIVDKDAFES